VGAGDGVGVGWRWANTGMLANQKVTTRIISPPTIFMTLLYIRKEFVNSNTLIL